MNIPLQKRIKKLRKSRGLNQVEFSEKTGISQRMIAYYEKEVHQIPSDNIIKLSKALKVTTDELLGLKIINFEMTKDETKVYKKVKKILKLTKVEQQIIFNMINGFLK